MDASQTARSLSSVDAVVNDTSVTEAKLDYKSTLKEQADENSKQWYIIVAKDWETSPKADAIKKSCCSYHTDEVKSYRRNIRLSDQPVW